MCSRYMDAKPLGLAGRSLIALCKSLLKERSQSNLCFERDVRAGVMRWRAARLRMFTEGL